MKIVVLAGGLSPERDVSLSSGSLVANALMANGHHVFLLDLYKGFETNEPYKNLFQNTENYTYVIPPKEPDLLQLKKETNNGDALIGKNVIEICSYADLVFVALHGDLGENGKLQGILDSYGIPYTGTGYIGSLLAMDKDLSKQIMVHHNIPTADWIVYDTKKGDLSEISSAIGFPCVVKPCSCGSSVGVSIVYNQTSLVDAITFAAKYEHFLLVEKMIVGREISVGILDQTPLPIIEIIPKEGFYDYTNKYQKGCATEICPAPLPDELTANIQSLALKVHQVLRLGDYARIDFIIDNDCQVICLEANTLPGMTPTSLLPQEAAAAGISYNELCNKIAEMALCSK